MSTPAGSWIYEIGSATPGSGGGGTPLPGAPAVTIVSATVTARSDGTQQIEVIWTPSASATADNFSGVQVFVEDPDISALANVPLDGTAPLDATRQLSGKWNPRLATTTAKSPVTVLVNGDTSDRVVRIYLLAFGPHTNTALVRANLPGPTPSIAKTVPKAAAVYVSGQEHAWQVTNPKVNPSAFFDTADGPRYTLTFSYTPPDPSIPLPPGMEPFGGVDIWYGYLDAGGNIVQITPTDVSINVLAASGYDSSPYPPSMGTNTFLAFFVSRGVDNQPNTLVPGVTPQVAVTITYPPLGQGIAPAVTALTLGATTYDPAPDGSVYQNTPLTWTLPPATPRYGGLNLYLTAIDGVPQAKPPLLYGPLDNHATSQVLSTNKYPAVAQAWTITAISVDDKNHVADDPTNPQFSPSVVWNVGPPGAPGGGGNEYAPLVNLAPMAATVTDQQMSADGVQMMRFTFTGWANPLASDPRVNSFGGVKIAMQDSHGTSYFDADKLTSFTTPWFPAVTAQTLKFFWVSYNPQGQSNTLLVNTTPERDVPFAPTPGQIVPTRDPSKVWWSPEFTWPAQGLFQAQVFNAVKINVGQQLVVGGAPQSFGGAGGSAVSNGQIAVLNSGGTAVGWIGTQLPTQGDATPMYGAWFGQLWVGGHDPRDAPLWVNPQGIVVLGGLQYQSIGTTPVPPFISIQDQTKLEVGKIGARLDLNANGTVIPGVPANMAGAWFQQLAAGGPNLTNWKLLAAADATVKMRDIDLFQITYAPNSSGYSNHPTVLTFGLSAYVVGASSLYAFPGITLYDTSNAGTPTFGITIINRGLILSGYQGVKRASLVTFNGDASGSNNPQNFWAELALFSPGAAANATPNVYLASGYDAGGGNPVGDSTFYLLDRNGTINFRVDYTGVVTARGGYYSGSKQVIDSAGNWVGNPISGGGGVASLNGLTGALSIPTGGGLVVTPSGSQIQIAINSSLINASGAFVGAGVNVGGNGVGCGTMTHSVFGLVMDGTGAWVGKGAACPNDGIGAKALGTWTGLGYAFGLAGTFTFTTADGKTITVTGGLITAHTP